MKIRVGRAGPYYLEGLRKAKAEGHWLGLGIKVYGTESLFDDIVRQEADATLLFENSFESGNCRRTARRHCRVTDDHS